MDNASTSRVVRVFHSSEGKLNINPSRLETIISNNVYWKETLFLNVTNQNTTDSSNKKSKSLPTIAIDNIRRKNTLNGDEMVLFIDTRCEMFDTGLPPDFLDLFNKDISSPLISLTAETCPPYQLWHFAKILGIGYMHIFDTSYKTDLSDNDVHYTYPVSLPLPMTIIHGKTNTYWNIDGILENLAITIDADHIINNGPALYWDTQKSPRLAFSGNQLRQIFGEKKFVGASYIVDSVPRAALHATPDGAAFAVAGHIPSNQYIGATFNHEFKVLNDRDDDQLSLKDATAASGFFYYLTEIVESGEHHLTIKFTDDDKSWVHNRQGAFLAQGKQVIHGRQATKQYFRNNGMFAFGRWKDLEDLETLLFNRKTRGYVCS